MSATNITSSTAPPAINTLPQRKGIVKQVLSGDTIVIRAPSGTPPPEKQITFFHVQAPKLARRPGAGGEETKDEPWAWESREYLREKLVGKKVNFNFDKPTNSNREYGFVWLEDENGENVVESIVRAGLVTVRREGRQTPELQNLIELEEQAKSAGTGKWSLQVTPIVRNIKWTQENPVHIVDHYAGEPVRAIIEHVRDGSTVRAFLIPEFHYITLMIAGIRCPGVKLDAEGKPVLNVKIPYADQARYYVETRLLQQEVKIRLESVNNANFIGTILHPRGNIAESLLKEGLAKCVDWSMVVMKSGADKLRAAERVAKEKRLHLWKDYQSKAPAINTKEKDFTGIVVEVFNGDAVNVKLSNGAVKKVFFSSIRPPRDTKTVVAGGDGEEIMKIAPRGKNFRPLYEIPFMFEAREFLRKKLIGKKVQCTLDYISPARDNFPEKYCYSVVIGGQNVAEALVSKGLATCVRYRQDDDQRSSAYDQLLAAESQAIKGQKGMHGKKENTLRINDLTVDHSRIKIQYLPSWQRALRTGGIIEFVASGSRLRLYIPRDSCLVTFLLAGISCPRASRPALNGIPALEGEPFGDEALVFTRDRVIQRDVTVHIETTDKAATAVIGWLWIDNKVNLSIALVEEGLAEVHFSAEKSEYYRQLKTAEDSAKAAKKNIWANYVEQEVVVEKPVAVEEDADDKIVEERVVNYENVIITEVTGELTFFAQKVENRSKLEALTNKLHAEFNNNPPIVGTYVPKKGDLCAALFSIDKQWYRAKVERIQGNNASVLYVDYGNRETVPFNRLASLPTGFSEPAYATEYELALVKLPADNEDKEEAVREFASDVLNHEVQLNVEYKPSSGLPLATVYDLTTNVDIGKQLIADGLVLAAARQESKLRELKKVYKNAQRAARSAHLAIWKYGDITQDDAPEFSQ